MHSKKKTVTTRMTLWVNRAIGVLLVVLVFIMPSLLEWYCTHRMLSLEERVAILVAFYCCAVVVSAALWNMDRLLSNILDGLVFVRKNVVRIRRVQWCCGIVSLVCFPAALVYLPLIFLVVIMAFLCLVVNVVTRVMDAAVAIREENDLTI